MRKRTSGRSKADTLVPRLLVTLLLACSCGKGVDGWIAEGEAALKAYRLDEAEQAFLKALDRDPVSPRALYGLGWTQHLRGNDVAARVYFEQCILVAPDYYGGYKGMGSVHLAMGYYGQAEASLQRAIDLKPDEAATYASLGYVYFVTDRLDRAEEAFRKAVALEPDRGEVYYLMAELRARQGALEEAIRQLDLAESKSIQEEKFRFLARKLRGQVLLRLALAGLPANEELKISESERNRRLQMLDEAETALDSAQALSVFRDRVQLNRLTRKVRRAKTRVGGDRISP